MSGDTATRRDAAQAVTALGVAVVVTVVVSGPWRWSSATDVAGGITLGLLAAVIPPWLTTVLGLIMAAVLGTRLRAVKVWCVWFVRRGSRWRATARWEDTVEIVAIPDGERFSTVDVVRLGRSSLAARFGATLSGSLLLLLAARGGFSDTLGDRWLTATGGLLLVLQALRGVARHEGRLVPVWTAARAAYTDPSTRDAAATVTRWQCTAPTVRPRDWPAWLAAELDAELDVALGDEPASGETDEIPADPAGRVRRLNAGMLALQRSLDGGDALGGLALARSLVGAEPAASDREPPVPFLLAGAALMELRVGGGAGVARTLLGRIPPGTLARTWTPAVLVEAELMARTGAAAQAAALLARERDGIRREMEIWPGVDWLLEQCEEALGQAETAAAAGTAPAVLPAELFGVAGPGSAEGVFAYGMTERSEWRFKTPLPGASS